MAQWIARLGFDMERLRFSLRTAAVLKLREIRGEVQTPPDVVHAIDAALARIRNIAGQPERALPALDTLARRRARTGAGEPDLVAAAATALRDNLPFFKRAAP